MAPRKGKIIKKGRERGEGKMEERDGGMEPRNWKVRGHCHGLGKVKGLWDCIPGPSVVCVSHRDGVHAIKKLTEFC